MGKRKRRLLTIALAAGLAPFAALAAGPSAEANEGAPDARIVVGREAPSLERFASAEVQRYLYHLTGDTLEVVREAEVADRPGAPLVVLGQRGTNEVIADLVDDGQLPAEEGAPGPEGFAIRTVRYGGRDVIAVMGSDDNGTLYGAYTLLEQYGARFHIDGDVLAAPAQPFAIKQLDIAREPAVRHRGLLPWHDFLNGPSGFSYEDFKEYLDQMAKMKMNTLVLHNYADGHGGRPMNEPFMSFQWRGVGHDGWLDTSVDNQRWGMDPFVADDLAFGAGDYFTYDVMGSDAARFTKEQPDAQHHIFLKAKAMMQKIIRYAHSRGMELVLGTDFDIAPREIMQAGGDPLDPEVLAARIDDILATYPELNYIQLHFHEHSSVPPNPTPTGEAIEALEFVHGYLKQRAPQVRLLTGGWFQEDRFPEMDAALPKDIIFSGLLPHDMSVRPEWTQLSSGRERWPIVWMEHDADLSQPQFGVRRMAEQLPKLRELGAEGTFGILWRTRQARTNVSYLAQDAWRPAGDVLDPVAFYRDYAAHAFGEEVAGEAAEAFLDIEGTGFPKLSGATVEYGKWAFSGCCTELQVATWRRIKERFLALRPSVTEPSRRSELDHYIDFMTWMERFWIAHGAPGPADGRNVERRTTLDECDSIEGWTASAANTVTADTSERKQGTASCSSSGPGEVFFRKRFATPVDAAVTPANGIVSFWLYVSDPAALGSGVGQLELTSSGTSDADEYAWNLAAVAPYLSQGWNQVRLPLRAAGTIGSPDLGSIDFLRLYLFANEPVTLKLDDVHFAEQVVPDDPAQRWEDLKASGFREAIEAYKTLVSDMPAQGGLLSAAGGRWYGPAYRPLEQAMIRELPAPPTEQLVVKGTADGARLTWRPPGGSGRIVGYHVYRRPAAGGEFERITSEPVASTSYEDRADGEYAYAVTAVGQRLVNYFLVDSAGTQPEEDLEPDHGYYGTTFTLTSNNSVTNDFGYPRAMRSLRWGPEFGYRFDVPEGYDRYRVELYFAELFYGADGQSDPVGRRVFDIAINGTVVREDFDIAREAGGALRGTKLVFDVPVDDRGLDIHFTPELDNPQVNAIRAYPIDADGTPLPERYEPPEGIESPRSYEERVQTGSADDTAPRVLQIPRHLEAVRGEPLRVTALAVDERAPDEVSATLHYRPLGKGPWRALAMRRNPLARAYAVFADIPASAVRSGSVEYYVSATDGANVGHAPAGAPDRTASAVVVARDPRGPGAAAQLRAAWHGERDGVLLTWKSANSHTHEYNIYRSERPGFPPSRSTYVTYVPSRQRVFRDVNVTPGKTYYYKVEPETIDERTGPAREVRVTVPAG